jgi:putative hemolysin
VNDITFSPSYVCSIGKTDLSQDEPHIIDKLIVERAPQLATSPFWPVLWPIMKIILGYEPAKQMMDKINGVPSAQVFNYLSEFLNLKVTSHGLENLPSSGRVIIVSNHPSGMADSVALFDAVRAKRPDIKFWANAGLTRSCPNLLQTLIPIEWTIANRTHAKTRTTFLATKKMMQSEGILAIFPAGRLSKLKQGRLTDREWMTGFVAAAKKFNAPILPVHIKAPNAFWYHMLDVISDQLRNLTVFRDLLNKKGASFKLVAGPLIMPQDLAKDNKEASAKLREYIETSLAKRREH